MKKTIALTSDQTERLSKLATAMEDDPRWGINIRSARKGDRPNVVAIAALDEGIASLELASKERAKAKAAQTQPKETKP